MLLLSPEVCGCFVRSQAPGYCFWLLYKGLRMALILGLWHFPLDLHSLCLDIPVNSGLGLMLLACCLLSVVIGFLADWLIHCGGCGMDRLYQHWIIRLKERLRLIGGTDAQRMFLLSFFRDVTVSVTVSWWRKVHLTFWGANYTKVMVYLRYSNRHLSGEI